MPSFIVPTALATAADLNEWMAGSPLTGNATVLLRSATTLVLNATSGARYDVDLLTGLATDPLTLQAMNDATCIQAAAWDAIKYNPLTGGVITSGVKTSKSIGTAHITYADGAMAAQSRADAIASLVPDAARVLRLRGLITSQLWVAG